MVSTSFSAVLRATIDPEDLDGFGLFLLFSALSGLIWLAALFLFARRTWRLFTRDAPEWAPPPEVVAEGAGPFREPLVEIQGTARVPPWIVASSTLSLVVSLALAKHAYWNSRACDIYRAFYENFGDASGPANDACRDQNLAFLRSIPLYTGTVVAAALLLAVGAWLLPRRRAVRWRIVRWLTSASCALSIAALGVIVKGALGVAVKVPGALGTMSLPGCLLKEWDVDPRADAIVQATWLVGAGHELLFDSVLVALVVLAMGAWIRFQARESAPFGRRRNAEIVRDAAAPFRKL